MPTYILIAILSSLVIAVPTLADEELTEETQQRINELNQKSAQIERAIAALDSLEAAADALGTEFFADRLRVFPSSEVCTCLREKRPIIVTFQTYLNLTYLEYEYSEPESLDEEDREIFEATLAARDSCATTAD